MLIKDLFSSDITRPIPPVVYFHEQGPDKLLEEVSEYIITGGWPENHPNHRRVPSGIHEQYVKLLEGILSELNRTGGPDLPNAWISGFYGSGKSSFAKLLGFALDGVSLADGTSLSEAWLACDRSPDAPRLRTAWRDLRAKIEPIAVVFDIGSIARDGEHIHMAAVRRVQQRLGYCDTDPNTALFELQLERDGEWSAFEKKALEVLKKPWSQIRTRQLANEDFSLVLSELYPKKYIEPMSWIDSHSGASVQMSPDEAVAAIRDMIKFRNPRATLFLVIDEVSQYVLSNKDRVDRLRAFATALGEKMRGRVWLFALGQQKLDEQADDSFLVWAKDRFPRHLQVHLDPTNIRDVVHQRLLKKTPEAETLLRGLFVQHRPELQLYAYGCAAITSDEFIDAYPMLPDQFDLILQITSALRTRSSRAQGDAQAIRGLLQLLGELFRAGSYSLSNEPVGRLITLDAVYDVQHTSLDSDTQASMSRVLEQCKGDDGLLVRAAKVVALLELIQETVPTTAQLVASCLYDRLDTGDQVKRVTEALEALRARNLLGFSEKTGYKVQSSAAEEWERDRRDISIASEKVVEIVQKHLEFKLAETDSPRLMGRPFPWTGLFSDGKSTTDAPIKRSRDESALCVDFRLLNREERTDSLWVRKSDESAFSDRLLWVAGDAGGDPDALARIARELGRSQAMVSRFKARRDSLTGPKKMLLQNEENRVEELEKKVRDTVADAWMAGRLYFRGRPMVPQELGSSFPLVLLAAGTNILPLLYPHFIVTTVEPAELLQLIATELTGASRKFIDELGILEVDKGRINATCTGPIPARVEAFIRDEGGVVGLTLLSKFSGPPHGITHGVVKACVAGLLRAGRLRIKTDGPGEITAFRDAGVRDLFDKDTAFRKATFFPAGEDDIGPTGRAKICRFFQDFLQVSLEAEDHLIADAVGKHFKPEVDKLRSVFERLNHLPGRPTGPEELIHLQAAFEECLSTLRETKYTVKKTLKNLNKLLDGVRILRVYHAELTDSAIAEVCEADRVLTYQVAQLEELGLIKEESGTGVTATNVAAAAHRVREHMKSTTPWRGVTALSPDLDEIRAAYRAERGRLMLVQERELEEARAALRLRDGFSTLSADNSHKVLRPFGQACTETTDDAVAPTLLTLRDQFKLKLHSAEAKANEILDELLNAQKGPPIIRLELSLRNRVVRNAAEVEALVLELRKRLMEKINSGAHVRLD